MKRAAPAKRTAAKNEPIDWRVTMLAQIRRLIQQADPEIVEEIKWRKPSNPAGVPVWSHGGILCTGETYKSIVKITFAKGASLPDPTGLFNSSLEGSTRRAIDFHEGDKLNEKALEALIHAAVALNTTVPKSTTKSKPTKVASARASASSARRRKSSESR
jgi:hypothetical protein